MRALLLAAILLAAIGCAEERPAAPTYHANENPDRLSDWGMVTTTKDALVLGEKVTPYDLATPLFSDYAKKLRTVWLPDGQAAQYHTTQSFDFPVGAVITKTFYYPQQSEHWDGVVSARETPPLTDGVLPLDGLRLIETRVLVHRANGWAALPYVWNDEQTDAVLKRAGAMERLSLVRDENRVEEFAYIVPNANQCAGCHASDATTKAIQPIGPKARHLNKKSTIIADTNQLDHWREAGLLTGDITLPAPQNADWRDETFALDARARAYLDINCSHCHNPNGPADTSGLNLEPDAAHAALGLCKLPIAAGSGTGGRLYDIVPGDPDRSITVFRMETTDPGAMMPELGRSVSHEEGVRLITEWIAEMTGGCG